MQEGHNRTMFLIWAVSCVLVGCCAVASGGGWGAIRVEKGRPATAVRLCSSGREAPSVWPPTPMDFFFSWSF